MGVIRGGNKTGAKRNRGGALARKTGIYIDYSCFADIIAQIDEYTDNIADIVAESMEEAGETLANETIEALAKSNLPAQGEYWSGRTEDSVVKNPKAEIYGNYVEIGLGFDKSMPGEGGLLITGTPRMKPDKALEAIYGTKKYETKMKNQIRKKLQQELADTVGG